MARILQMPYINGISYKGEAMKLKKRKLQKKGQAILEYIIITSLIGIICLSLIKQFGTTLKTRLNHINATIIEKVEI